MIPIATSSFMHTRFAASQADGAFRMRHWTEAIDMMDPGAGAALVGMGLGSFPRTYLLKNPAGAVVVPAVVAGLDPPDRSAVDNVGARRQRRDVAVAAPGSRSGSGVWRFEFWVGKAVSPT